MPDRAPPVVVEPLEPQQGSKQAVVIFMHGLGDDAAGVENVARQFQQNRLLPHVRWVFPNARHSNELMQQAWYMPSPLSPFASARPELDDPEDEQGLLESRAYVESLLRDQVAAGVPVGRIVLGGFSQGCAMTLLTGFTSADFAGKLAGLLGIAGYFPLADRAASLRQAAGLPDAAGRVPVMVTRGTRDMLVPRRFYSQAAQTIKGLGVEESLLEAREYENVGHTINGAIFRDMGQWLDKVLPHA